MEILALLWISCAIERTFATEELERLCLLVESLDLDLLADCGRKSGFEFAFKVGRLVIGNKFPLGLAGQAISRSLVLHGQMIRAAASPAVVFLLWLMHSRSPAWLASRC
jgi:hypothetical protein